VRNKTYLIIFLLLQK